MTRKNIWVLNLKKGGAFEFNLFLGIQVKDKANKNSKAWQDRAAHHQQ